MKKCALIFVIAMTMTVFTAIGAQAYQATFFGEDLGPVSSWSNSDTARNNFFSNLVGVGTEDFEGFATDTTGPLTVDFGVAGTATLAGAGSIQTGPNSVGRFPISGDNYWGETSSANFSVTFSAPIAAFGFYGIDLGDFSGQITVTTVGGSSTVYEIPHTIGAPNGSVCYWGVIDTDDPFMSIAFNNTGSSTDYFGFDDFTIGSVEQVVPNTVPIPGAVWLLGSGLVGLAGLRKKIRK